MTSLVRELPSAEYPPRLRDLPNPPPRLWVAGELPRGPAVAIVGTREPTPEGERFTVELGRDLARAGVAVFSGGALGIDAAAHRGALEGNGATVVVAPSSFDLPYPRRHADLYQDIVSRGGAFLTSFPPGTQARQHHFFARNAELAALTDALVVVETRFDGGARNAAKVARRLGRRVLVVPGPPWVDVARGCILEIQNGATVVASASDVLRHMGQPSPRPTAGRARSDRVASTDPVRDRVLLSLRGGPSHPDDLCREAAVPAAELQALLLTLTLEGIVVSDPSGRVLLVTNWID